MYGVEGFILELHGSVSTEVGVSSAEHRAPSTGFNHEYLWLMRRRIGRDKKLVDNHYEHSGQNGIPIAISQVPWRVSSTR